MLKSLININKINENKENKNNDLLHYFISHSKKIQFLSSFFKDIYCNIIIFKESISKNINLLKDKQIKKDIKINLKEGLKIDESIQYFYDNTLEYLDKLTDILEKYNELVIIPFNEFKNEYDNKSLLIINNLSSLKNVFNEERNNVLFYQKKYFLDVKEYLKLKKDIDIKNKKIINDNKDKKNDEELLCKMKYKIEIDKNSYKYQVDYFNYFYQNEFLKKYKKYYKELENIDNDKILFMRNIIYLYSINLNDFKKTIEDYISSINSIFKKIKNDKNKIFNDNFEELSNYENINRNINNEYKTINKEINYIYDNNQIDNIYFNTKHHFLTDNNNNSINKIINYKDNKSEYFSKFINKYFEYLEAQKQIPLKNMCEINNLLFNCNEFYIIFIEEFLIRFNKLPLIKINNLNNFNHLDFLLKSKLLSHLNNNNNLILLFLLLGQKIYYSNNNDDNDRGDNVNKNIFLCNSFNKIYLFKLNSFWDELFQILLNCFFQKEENVNNNLIHESIIKINDDISFDEINISNESIGNDKKYVYKNIDALIINTDIFNSPIIKKNEENKNQIFTNIHNILLFYISSLINYNYNIINSTKLLIKYCNKLSLSNQVISFYITFLKNYSYSAKNNSKQFYNSVIIRNKNEEKIISLEEKKFIILSKVMKYLDNENLIKILTLNKKYNSEMKDKIYKIILKHYMNKKNEDKNKELNIKLYINIWKNILNYQKVKSLYPYEEYKEQALKKIYNKHHNSDFSIIDADCLRTNFINGKVADNRKSLNNILKTIFIIIQDTTYCQGMNYIVGFILSICGSEEEAFYISLGFLKYTSFKNIFINDLKMLRLYFAIFDKLLYIYLPNIYSHLSVSKIYSNYYISPIFITLFTNLMNGKLKIDPFVEIINLFIIHGWKSIFNITLNIFKLYEDIILDIRSENLLQFLTSELTHKFIIEIEKNMRRYKNNPIQISKKLINEIENEFLQFLYLVNENDK